MQQIQRKEGQFEFWPIFCPDSWDETQEKYKGLKGSQGGVKYVSY
jgi:hypothetical protein